MLANDRWLARWPDVSYSSLNARTLDHSPLVLRGDVSRSPARIFWFDNYLAASSQFISTVQRIWGNSVLGTAMYSVTRKLKALKPLFRAQRKQKRDLASNVKLAQEFLATGQNLLHQDRHDRLLLLLENCCRMVYLKAVLLEQQMLQQRAKLQWLKGGDHCTRFFFCRVATRRARMRVFQINGDDGHTHTSSDAHFQWNCSLGLLSKWPSP
ncbi:UNVERIFIED_CONTAM: hypothetical protein Slati_3104200 [Sesamum latifolium]|uniref:Reverse transcriptase n=1 Tax=Sesamum latifolium TaxID=2727402 RepID=A0AAW2UW25_9LAMI